MEPNPRISPDEFSAKLKQIVEDGFVSLSVAIGTKLNLFQLLATISNDQGKPSPRTAQEIADAGNLKERYVREGCAGMVCAGLIDCDATCERFWFPQGRLEVMRGPKSNVAMLNLLPALAGVTTKLQDCFKSDGAPGLSYDDFTEFDEFMASYSKPFFEDHLIPDCLSLVPEVLNELKSGIKCLDIACGSGYCGGVLAENFPKSKFWGVDFSEEAIENANLLSKEKGQQNSQYLFMDAAELKSEWSSSMDLVTAISCVHDLAYPHKVLKEIFRVLKPNGTLLMVDKIGTSNPAKDRDAKNPRANIHYAASLFHCMPVSLSFRDGVGLGTMWGEATAKQMLCEAGFVNVQTFDMTFQESNLLYSCKKPMMQKEVERI